MSITFKKNLLSIVLNVFIKPDLPLARYVSIQLNDLYDIDLVSL
jgi:hypothetical protein